MTFNVILGYDDLVNLKVPKTRFQKNVKFDLTEVLDGYIYAVSDMHVYNRSLTDEVVSQAQEVLKKIIDRAVPADSLKSCIVELSCAGKSPEYIGLDRFEIARHLRNKHPYVIDYSRFAFDLSGY